MKQSRKTDFPTSPFPLLPLRNGVLFPGTAITLPLGRKRSIALVEQVLGGSLIGVGVQRDPAVEDPSIADLLPVATLARVVKVIAQQQFHALLIEGISRFRIKALTSSTPYWQVEGEPLEEPVGRTPEALALAEILLEKVREIEPSPDDKLGQLPKMSVSEAGPGVVADVVASALGLPPEQEAQVLLCLDVVERLRLVHRLLTEAKAMAELKSRLAEEVQEELGRAQREVLLRQQLRAIQKELGEDEHDEQADQLRERLTAAHLPEEAARVVEREWKRLEGMNPAQPEHHVIQSYLEFIADLPWDKRATVSDDLVAVESKLEADHYGLHDVKQRILEHLAVRKMTGTQRGAVLSLVGPPGVGKTSLGQSIADATGRPLVRISLGGVRDEAEIRGHRRTYVGALPGRILNGLRQAGAKNPILLIDEVDKLGVGWMGSPEAALLEVLDPEQNHTFTDHYLELPFDLSEVFFICTANTTETLSPPLRDRLEVIEIQGYTLDEKLEIAERYLLPDLLEQHGLAPTALSISRSALATIIAEYTREAGVRQVKRELTRICRGVTLQLARSPEGKSEPVRVDSADLRRYLGKQRFFNEAAERTAVAGVATGLAWTPVGGEILFVESSRMPGSGRMETTGMLGDVMKESARAALTYIRSHAEELGVDPKFLERQDLHIHVPAGAIPKDGPSAGVTIFTALASLLTNRRARADTAMTGECTLRGRVLPVGGIKAKILAAHRAGIHRVILPLKNERDLEELPEEVRGSLSFVFADDMHQVLEAALEEVPAAPPLCEHALRPERTAVDHAQPLSH